jgi:glycosyltransferase involved in cell wall biosynthesis
MNSPSPVPDAGDTSHRNAPARSRILFIGPLPDPITGQSLACQVLLEAMRLRHDVDVVNLSKQGFRQGVSSFGRVLEIGAIAWQVWRLRRMPDAVYFTVSESYAGNAKDMLIYLICLSRLGRTMIHLHGGAGMREIMANSHPLWQRLNRYFLRRIGSVVILGPRHASIFAGAVSVDRLHVVPNFAEDALFVDDAAIGRKFECTEPLRLLFVSNLLPGKGHAELVAALELLDDAQRARLRVDVAGGFESPQQKAAFLASIGHLPNVAYHGTVRGEAKRRLFADAHVFCLPTYYPYEGQPISILEAYASGCAVITTDHSGILDVFSDAVNGYCVEKRSAASLAAAIRRVLENPASAASMASANLHAARERYRKTTFTTAMLRLLDLLLRSSATTFEHTRTAATE